ncbi:MAG: RsiV family protein [Thermoflexibacteraceae bacterium]|jgi:hypothetical protein
MTQHFYYRLTLSIYFFIVFLHPTFSQKTLKLPECFYKRMEGSVGKEKVIEMDLIKIDTLIKGTYYFRNNSTPLELTGTVDAAGNIIINELGRYDVIKERYPVMGTFKGVFQTDTHIKGQLSRVKVDTTAAFELKESYEEGSVQFDLIKKEKEYGDCGREGTCAAFTLIYPQMKKSSVQDKVNRHIISQILSHYEDRAKTKLNSIDDLLTDFIGRYKDEEKNFAQLDAQSKPVWNHLTEVLVVYNAANMLCLQLRFYISESGEKPLEVIHYANFNLLTGQVVKLDDLMIKDYKPKLTKIAEEFFRRHYGFSNGQSLKGFNFKNGDFELNDNYSFNRKGIIFRYNPYEIAAYSMGSPQIFIPYEAVRQLINWESILGEVVKD